MKFSKGQFFIVTAFIVISILFTISRWLEPVTILDVSDVVAAEESFMMNNIVEKAYKTVKTSKKCNMLNYSLQEYKNFVESYASSKGMWLNFNYTLSSDCSLVRFNISLKSTRASLTSAFDCSWP